MLLEAAGIPVEGLFLNADGAFDPKQMRQACAARHVEANGTRNRRAADWQTDDDTLFDDVLSRRRVVVEQANAWLDGFKTLLVRYETRVENWLTFIGWRSASCFYEKCLLNRLFKQLWTLMVFKPAV